MSIYGLSWGVPGWVGNGSTSSGKIGESYCSKDNIAYQTDWVTCMRDQFQLPITYLGVWNEMTWCGTDYVLELRAALDAAGHIETKIVLPDGGTTNKDLDGRTFLEQARTSVQLRAAAPIMGFHYPCGYPELSVPDVATWASEDFSSHNLGEADPEGGPGWTSGSYWGRLLNQNFVRMNMTTTIAWALVWSVLPGLGCEGDGLTLANSPWSGHYEVDAAIWTTAHWTQFVKPDWRLLVPGQGSGLLPEGGSYVAAIEPAAGATAIRNFSVVIETLQGAGAGPACKLAQNATQVQTVLVSLSPEMAKCVPDGGLALWRTTATAMFEEQRRVTPKKAEGGAMSVELTIEVDAMYTLTTVLSGFHGRAPTPAPPASRFPLPYSDAFESYLNDTVAKYFTDQGGSFAVQSTSAGGVLRQWTRERPGKNSWGGPKPSNPPPVTLIGGDEWSGYEACVDASVDGCVGSGDACYAMVCAHATSFSTWSGWPPSSVCLRLNHTKDGSKLWDVVVYHNLPQDATSLAHGQLRLGDGRPGWNRMCIATSGCGNLSASVDAQSLLPSGFVVDSSVGLGATGRVALGTGWHSANFDNLNITATANMTPDATLFQCIAACNGTQRFVGFVGGLLTVDIAKNIHAVARFCGDNSVPTATQAGEVALLELQAGSSGFKVIAGATVTLNPGCAGSDASGFVWADLPETVSLHPGKQYVLAAENKPGWKFLGTSGQDMPQVSGDGVQVKPIYTSANAASVNAGTANWIQAGLSGSMYGPVNARALSLKADDSETTQRAAMSGQVAALTHRVDEMAATIEQQAAAIKRLLLVQQAAPAPRPSRVSVLEFGADPTGQADSTAAIQAALNRFGGQGGIVDVPSGFFRCNSGLVVPAGVTLLGTFRSTPTHEGKWFPPADHKYPPANLTGSVLECYGGRGSASGPAFITLRDSSTLEGVVIIYPEQVRVGTPVPYSTLSPLRCGGRTPLCSTASCTTRIRALMPHRIPATTSKMSAASLC